MEASQPCLCKGRFVGGGHEFARSASEFVSGYPEAARDAVGDIPGGVSYASLKVADGRRMEIDAIGESLLRQLRASAEHSDRATENDLWTLADPHS